MSNSKLGRYELIKTLLDDPVNFAIAQREVVNRRKSMVTPPVEREGGGFIFLRTLDWPFPEGEQPDPLAEVYEAPGGWMAFLGGKEVGPKKSMKEALGYAKKYLENKGHTIIDELPWG